MLNGPCFSPKIKILENFERPVSGFQNFKDF